MVPELTGQECWSAVNLEEFLFISLSSPPGSSLAHRCLLNPYLSLVGGEGGFRERKRVLRKGDIQNTSHIAFCNDFQLEY